MSKKTLERIRHGLEEVAEKKSKGSLLKGAKKVKIQIPDVKAIREKTGLTQERFARNFGWSVDTVRSWEQGRRIPDHSAFLLLSMISRRPAAMLEEVEQIEEAHLMAAE